MKASRYQINLNAHLADCEMNYLRLSKLLPESLAAGQTLTIGLGAHALNIAVRECAPYTTFLEMRLAQASQQPWSSICLKVRMYHDAALAEVSGAEGVHSLRQRYDYPNSKMFQQDEKAQLNRFLGEWLSLCLRHGHHSTLAVADMLGDTDND